MEYLLYILAIFVGIIAFKIAWNLYPKKLSRKERYYLSDLKFFENRISYAIACLIVFGGGFAYTVHYFYSDNEKSQVKSEKVYQSIDTIQKENNVLSYDTIQTEYSIIENKDDYYQQQENDSVQMKEVSFNHSDSIADIEKAINNNDQEKEGKIKKKKFIFKKKRK